MFITPLDVGECLIAWGVDPARIRELDWWNETNVGGIRLTAVPAQRHVKLATPLWRSDIVILVHERVALT
ncbi:hypothetical protein CY658_18880 [Variovorax sp. RO1]|uniref:MBL fold metallo-hydrolase n=1 Tax=Variovorax sp. RO1 TaxID=2066034 RepID=UPI000C716F6C|nr:hypothetical protein [Variovorax sp. RO1]PLC04094.1 hypothetical protein CY658_18880 [Variovorax sp. RO1]